MSSTDRPVLVQFCVVSTAPAPGSGLMIVERSPIASLASVRVEEEARRPGTGRPEVGWEPHRFCCCNSFVFVTTFRCQTQMVHLEIDPRIPQ